MHGDDGRDLVPAHLAPARAGGSWAFREVPPGKLVQAASQLSGEVYAGSAKWGRLALMLLPFAPTIDGSVLPVAPLTAIAAGQGSSVSLLTGTNRDEWRLFLVAPGVIDQVDGPALDAAASGYGLSPDDLAVYQRGAADMVLASPALPGSSSSRRDRGLS